MNPKLKLTASQQPVFIHPKENLECIKDVLKDHKDSDWILTPEGSLSGYTTPPCLNQTGHISAKHTTEALKEIEDLQKELGVGLALGTGWTESDGFPYNQIRFYGPKGLSQVYAKRLLTQGWEGGGELHYYLPGQSNKYLTLDPENKVLGSALICNDFWASPRVSPRGNPYYQVDMAKSNVDVVFVSANCNVEEFDPLMYTWHENHLQMFAREFGFWIVVSNACTSMTGEPVDRVQCPSGIIGPSGDWLAKCSDKGEMDSATVEIEVTPRIQRMECSDGIVFRE